jgi:hypothetical protein
MMNVRGSQGATSIFAALRLCLNQLNLPAESALSRVHLFHGFESATEHRYVVNEFLDDEASF